jgi:hypothetical protein
MAQTKARSGRSTSSKSKSTRSKSRNGASAQSKRSSSTAKRTSQQRRGNAGRSTSKRSSTASRNGGEKSKLAAFADRAKAPAAAGGAALIGLAGGLALSRSKRKNGLRARLPDVKMPKVKAPKVSMPKPDSALKTVGSAAGEVADRSQQVGRVAAEIQKASDAIANSKRS